jgi:hypothetical protein
MRERIYMITEHVWNFVVKNGKGFDFNFNNVMLYLYINYLLLNIIDRQIIGSGLN